MKPRTFAVVPLMAAGFCLAGCGGTADTNGTAVNGATTSRTPTPPDTGLGAGQPCPTRLGNVAGAYALGKLTEAQVMTIVRPDGQQAVRDLLVAVTSSIQQGQITADQAGTQVGRFYEAACLDNYRSPADAAAEAAIAAASSSPSASSTDPNLAFADQLKALVKDSGCPGADLFQGYITESSGGWPGAGTETDSQGFRSAISPKCLSNLKRMQAVAESSIAGMHPDAKWRMYAQQLSGSGVGSRCGTSLPPGKEDACRTSVINAGKAVAGITQFEDL